MKWAGVSAFLLIGAANLGNFWQTTITIAGQNFELPGLPFSMDIILLSSAFFLAGHLLKERIKHFSLNFFILSLAVFTFLGIALFTNAHTDLNRRLYSDPVFATCGAITGIYIVISFACLMTKLKSLKTVFTTLGSSSLYILIFHFYINAKLYHHLSAGEEMALAPALIAFFACLTLPLVIKGMIVRNDFMGLFFEPFKTNNLLQRISARR